MDNYTIEIIWEGPLSIEDVIASKNNGGNEVDGWAGCDYGVYQIYGPHILHRDCALLYIGQAPKQTFSERLKQHKACLLKDDNWSKIKIHLGRLENSPEYTKKDNWESWYRDVDIAEAILIYKYSPNYNSSRLGDYPDLHGLNEIKLAHRGNRGSLMPEDSALSDFKAKL